MSGGREDISDASDLEWCSYNQAYMKSITCTQCGCRCRSEGYKTCGRADCYNDWVRDDMKLREKVKKDLDDERNNSGAKLCLCGAKLTPQDTQNKRTMCFKACSASPKCSKCGKPMDYMGRNLGKGACWMSC